MARKRYHSPTQSSAQVEGHRGKHAESDDQTANSESQQMFALRPLLTKQKSSDKEVEQFHTEVQADHAKLNTLLQQRIDQAENNEKRRRKELARATCDALGLSESFGRNNVLPYPGTKIAGNALYASLNDMIAFSEGLVKEYQRLDNMAGDLQDENTKSMVDAWMQSVGKTETQLRMGARIAQRNVVKVLGAELQDEEGKLDHDGENEDEGVDANDASEEKELNMELHKTLKYTERAVKKMVKGLPNDDTE